MRQMIFFKCSSIRVSNGFVISVDFLISLTHRESIVFGSNFQNGDFNAFTLFEVL